MNKTRFSGERAKAADALPDVDIDFQGLERDNVKRYGIWYDGLLEMKKAIESVEVDNAARV